MGHGALARQESAPVGHYHSPGQGSALSPLHESEYAVRPAGYACVLQKMMRRNRYKNGGSRPRVARKWLNACRYYTDKKTGTPVGVSVDYLGVGDLGGIYLGLRPYTRQAYTPRPTPPSSKTAPIIPSTELSLPPADESLACGWLDFWAPKSTYTRSPTWISPTLTSPSLIS